MSSNQYVVQQNNIAVSNDPFPQFVPISGHSLNGHAAYIDNNETSADKADLIAGWC